MKKITIALSAVIILAAFSFAGCGKAEDGMITTTTSTTTTTSATTATSKTSVTTPNSIPSSTTAEDDENLEDKITSELTKISEKMD